MSGGQGFYRLMLLMTQEDYILKEICPQCDEDPEKIMDFLLGLPEEQRHAFLRRNKQHFGEKGPLKRLARAVERGVQDGLLGTFHHLADSWQIKTAFDSYVGTILGHPAYRQIVDLGMPAVPLILQELREEPDDDWLLILEEIIGEDGPAIPDELQESQESQPRINIWLEWGKSRGLI